MWHMRLVNFAEISHGVYCHIYMHKNRIYFSNFSSVTMETGVMDILQQATFENGSFLKLRVIQLALFQNAIDNLIKKE